MLAPKTRWVRNFAVGCARAASCRAAQEGDELAPPHSITSSARASSIGGTVRRSILAVWCEKWDKVIRAANIKLG